MLRKIGTSEGQKPAHLEKLSFFIVGASVDVPAIQQELQDVLNSLKIYISKTDNIRSLLIEHIYHS